MTLLQIIPGFEDLPILNDLVFISTAMILAVLAYMLTFRITLMLFNKSSLNWPKRTIRQLRFPIFLLFLMTAMKITISNVQMSEVTAGAVNHSWSILLIVAIAAMLISVLNIVTDLVLINFDVEQEDNLRARKVHTQFRMIKRILAFIIVLLAAGAILLTFDSVREVGLSLLASAGIVGIILGFAAQKLIATIIAGFQIALTQPIRLDDVVVVEGEWGRIEEIRLTYVVVVIWDKRRLVLPTTYFIEQPFQNWTRVSADLLGTVFLHLDYTVPFDEIRKELTRVLGETDLWDGQVNIVQVTDCSEETVQVRVMVSAANSSKAWDLRVYVREKMVRFLQENYPESLPKTRFEFSKERVSA